MEISVEIDEGLLAELDQALTIQKMSRNEAFREALETWVAHMPKSSLCFSGLMKLGYDPDFVLDVERPGPEAFSVPRSKTP